MRKKGRVISQEQIDRAIDAWIQKDPDHARTRLKKFAEFSLGVGLLATTDVPTLDLEEVSSDLFVGELPIAKWWKGLTSKDRRSISVRWHSSSIRDLRSRYDAVQGDKSGIEVTEIDPSGRSMKLKGKYTGWTRESKKEGRKMRSIAEIGALWPLCKQCGHVAQSHNDSGGPDDGDPMCAGSYKENGYSRFTCSCTGYDGPTWEEFKKLLTPEELAFYNLRCAQISK